MRPGESTFFTRPPVRTQAHPSSVRPTHHTGSVSIKVTPRRVASAPQGDRLRICLVSWASQQRLIRVDTTCACTVVDDSWEELGCTLPVMVAVAMTRYCQKRHITRCEGICSKLSISGRIFPRSVECTANAFRESGTNENTSSLELNQPFFSHRTSSHTGLPVLSAPGRSRLGVPGLVRDPGG